MKEKYKIILGIALLSLSFFSCNNKKNDKAIHLSSSYTIDTISIQIDENYVQNYTSVRNRVNKNILYQYNAQNHSIDLFDLNKKQFINQIKFEKEGSDGVLQFLSFNITDSSLIIQNDAQYLITDFTGNVQKRISKEAIDKKLKGINQYFKSSNYLSISNFEDLVLDNKNNSIIIPIEISADKKSNNESYLLFINITTEEIQLLPLSSPDIMQKKSFGILSKPQIICTDSFIVYNFGFSSEIYKLDWTTKNIKFYNLESEYTKNCSDPIDKEADMKKQLDHYFHALFFHTIEYDKFRNQYYRLHTNKSDDVSVFNNKETYLTILSTDFHKIAEIKLPTNLYPIFNITKEGLLFQFMTSLYEDKFSYMILNTPNIKPLILNDIVEIKDSIKPEKTVYKKENSKEVITSENIKEFILKNMIYPPNELNNKIVGNVFIMLESDKSGLVKSCRIEEKATDTENKNLREEALRIGKLIQYTIPNSIFAFHVPFNNENYILSKNMQQKK